MRQPHPSQQDRQKARSDDVRFRLLRALDHGSDLSQRGLARETGASLGGVNALLNRMIAAGAVRIHSAETAPARFRIGYALTDQGRGELRRLSAGYLARRHAERAALGAEIASLEAEYGPGTTPGA